MQLDFFTGSSVVVVVSVWGSELGQPYNNNIEVNAAIILNSLVFFIV